MIKRKLIAIIGDTTFESGRQGDQWQIVKNIAKTLLDNNFRIVTGGIGDLPRAVYEGAVSSKNYSGNDLISILPGYDPSVAEDYSNIVIATGLDIARSIIISNSDAIIAVGGGAGTLMELSSAWELKRPIIAYDYRGWSQKLGNFIVDQRVRYENINYDKVFLVNSVEEIISLLNSILPIYNKRHKGIPSQ